MRHRIVSLLFVGLAAQVLGACGPTDDPPAAPHRVDEKAIAAELSRELPGLKDNAAFEIQVRDIVTLCKSSAEDFRINARTSGSADGRLRLRRQIRAGCPWRLPEVDKLLAEQRGADQR